jgi:hypothetical protein
MVWYTIARQTSWGFLAKKKTSSFLSRAAADET